MVKKPVPAEKIFTLPNILTLLRILLIPFIVGAYLRGTRMGCFVLLLLSGMTDIADGFIARRFGMVSTLGKILDPAADKLTQAAVLLCLCRDFPQLAPLVMLLVIKECSLGIFCLSAIKRSGEVHSSKWHGKLAAAILYLTLAAHILLPQMSGRVSAALVLAAGISMLCSFVLYFKQHTASVKADNNKLPPLTGSN